MNWLNEKDKIEIYNLIQTPYQEEILEAAEDMALGREFKVLYTPDQLANALVMVVNHFEGGLEYMDSLTKIEKALLFYQYNLILSEQNALAESQSHKGEADEKLSDSQELSA